MSVFGSARAAHCLLVEDVAAAVGHYRQVLGFEQLAMIGGTPPQIGFVRKYGETLMLQRCDGEVRIARQAVSGAGVPQNAGPPWDAVLQVPDVEAAHRGLTGRGATGVGELSATLGWPFFELHDGQGNLICVGQPLEPFLKVLSTPPSRRFARLRSRWREAVSARQEREHLREFQAFYAGLENKKDAFFMFFTSGLLHWVAHAESFVPPDANLVLLGSALTPDEQRWLRENLRRPFHHIRLPVDDITAWEFLFATSEHNFGWLDIDCFVLNSRLFEEMTELPAGHSMNCTWAADSGYGFQIARTHFLFVNVDAIRAVAALGVRPSPAAFDWGAWPRGFRQRRCFSKVPTRAEGKLLLKILPPDRAGRPRLVYLAARYDTLVMFQLLARVAGYPIRQVRELGHGCEGQVGTADGVKLGDWQQDMSDELFHMSGAAYYMNSDFGSDRAHFRAAELALLRHTVDRLPAEYAARQHRLAAEMAEIGVPPESVDALSRSYLAATPGLSGRSVELILDRFDADPVPHQV